MLCEKCGTNNPMKADQCFSCGATMPITPCGNGFADILSFDSHPERNAEVICQAQQETEERLRRELSIYKHQRKRLLKQMRIVTALAVVLLILSTVLAISLLRERAAGEQQLEQITKEETVQVPTKEQDSEANSSLPNVLLTGKNDFTVCSPKCPVMISQCVWRGTDSRHFWM